MLDESKESPREGMVTSSAADRKPVGSPDPIHRWIAEEGVIEGYLRDRLDAASAETFEEHYLGCEECVLQLEMAERFEHALRGVVAEEAAATTVRLGVLASVGRWLAQRPLMMATPWVLLVALATLGWQLVGERDRLASELAQARQPRAVTPALLLDVVRSTEAPQDLPSLFVDPGAGPSHLMLAVVTDGLTNPRGGASADVASLSLGATLETADGVPLWRGTDLTPSEGLLQLAIPSELLPPGTYRLRVARTQAPPSTEESVGPLAGGPLELTFRVVASAP